MSREHRISWNKNQLSKLNSAVRRYNNAIRRANKRDPLGARFRPGEIKYQDIKSEIKTARQLTNRVNSLLRATKQGVLDLVHQQDGSLITKYERREYAILRSVREKQKAAKLRELMRPKTPDEVHPYQLGKSWRLTPDKRPIESLSPAAIKSFIKSQQFWLYEASFEKNTRYVENYIKSLDTEFGGFEEYDEVIEKIKNWLMQHIHDDDAIEYFIEGAPDIGFNYSPMDRVYRFKIIEEYWSGHVGR